MEEERMAKASTTDATVEPVLPPPPTPTDVLVEEWHAQWFRNLGLPVELQNRIRSAADDLKTRLAGKE
jgi:hypothetical protein